MNGKIKQETFKSSYYFIKITKNVHLFVNITNQSSPLIG